VQYPLHKPWTVLSSDDGEWGVVLPDDAPSTDETVQAAIGEIAGQYLGLTPPATEDDARVETEARFDVWQLHTSVEHIEEVECGCEDEGWMCPMGDGPSQRVVWFPSLHEDDFDSWSDD
jgi:hypothetical protein